MSVIVSNNSYVSSYSSTGVITGGNQYSSGQNKAEAATYAPAINVTLSEAARAAMASETQDTSAESARNKLTELLERTGRDTLLEGDELVVDLSSFSREEIFAIYSNNGNFFSAEEQAAAGLELQQRFDTAMKGGYEVMLITGDYTDLYTNALEYLENAGDAEKNTAIWQGQYNAVLLAGEYLGENPAAAPEGIQNDPVAEFLAREAEGETTTVTNNMDTLASQAGTALDAIDGARGRMDGLLGFGSRTLSAIALNVSGDFSSSEINAARYEMKSRVSASVQDAFQVAGTSGDPTAFSKKLIAQYHSMSVEEREAVGLDQGYYDTIVNNYQTSLQISQTFNAGTSNTGSAQGGTASLLNFL